MGSFFGWSLLFSTHARFSNDRKMVNSYEVMKGSTVTRISFVGRHGQRRLVVNHFSRLLAVIRNPADFPLSSFVSHMVRYVPCLRF